MGAVQERGKVRDAERDGAPHARIWAVRKEACRGHQVSARSVTAENAAGRLRALYLDVHTMQTSCRWTATIA